MRARDYITINQSPHAISVTNSSPRGIFLRKKGAGIKNMVYPWEYMFIRGQSYVLFDLHALGIELKKIYKPIIRWAA